MKQKHISSFLKGFQLPKSDSDWRVHLQWFLFHAFNATSTETTNFLLFNGCSKVLIGDTYSASSTILELFRELFSK